MVYEWILDNREVLKIVYALVIFFICAIVVLKTDRLFKISDYQGLRYLRNAFFFYGVAFFLRFILGGLANPLPIYGDSYYWVVLFLSGFFVMVGSLFLLYSLIWKRLEKRKSYNSLLNVRSVIIYISSLIIVLLDVAFGTIIFVYSFQIALFLAMVNLSYLNYIRDNGKHPFLKFYFLTMVFGLIAWVLYIITRTVPGINAPLQIIISVINGIFFLLFLYGVLKITKK